MSGAAQVLSGSDLQRTLNEEVDPALREELNLRTTELRLFKVKTVPVSGKYYRIVVKYGGNFYGSGRREGAKIPGLSGTSGVQDQMSKIRTLELKFYRRFFYTAVDMSGPVRNAPATKSGGFGNLGKLVMDDTVENLKEMISTRFAGSQAGVFGKIVSVSGNTVTLEPLTTNIPWAGNNKIRIGMVMDVTAGAVYNALRLGYPDGGLRYNSGRVVSAVSEDTSTCTVTFADDDGVGLGTAAVDNDWAAGDHLVMYDSRGTAAIATADDYDTDLYQPMGIMDAVNNSGDSLFSNSYYGGLQKSSYVVLESLRVHNSGTLTRPTLDMINLAFERVEVDPYAGDAPNLIYCYPSIRRQIAAHLTATASREGTSPADPTQGVSNINPSRLMDPGRSNANLGIPGVEITTLGNKGAMMLYVSALAPMHRLILANTKTMLILEDKAAGFMDDDGQTLRNYPGYDGFYVVWKWYCSGLICWHPRKNAYITDLKGDPLTANSAV